MPRQDWEGPESAHGIIIMQRVVCLFDCFVICVVGQVECV